MTDDELLNDFLEAAKLEPDDPLVLYGLGNEYLKLGRYQEAIQTFAHLIEIQEDYSAAYRHLGQAYAGIGDAAHAIQTYETGIQVATQKGDLQTRKEMEVFLNRLRNG